MEEGVLGKMRIATMSGRLTAPRGRGYQFFPHQEWQEEFRIASQLGLYAIELVVDENQYEKHPLMSKSGVMALQKIIKKTGVKVNNIMIHLFLQKPLLRADKKWFKECQQLISRIARSAKQIGASSLEIPFLEKNRIETENEVKKIKLFLEDINLYDVFIGIESDLPARELLALIQSLKEDRLRAAFDTGNSAAAGYDPAKEIFILNGLLFNIHIKDRKMNGGTVPLGEGGVNFSNVFKGLKQLNYRGDLTLEAARGNEGDEKANMRRYLEFLKNYQ